MATHYMDSCEKLVNNGLSICLTMEVVTMGQVWKVKNASWGVINWENNVKRWNSENIRKFCVPWRGTFPFFSRTILLEWNLTGWHAIKLYSNFFLRTLTLRNSRFDFKNNLLPFIAYKHNLSLWSHYLLLIKYTSFIFVFIRFDLYLAHVFRLVGEIIPVESFL